MEYKRKDIEGFDGYEIDTVGNVFTNKTPRRRLISKDGMLSVRPNSSGYKQVGLYANKKVKYLLVHRLMWEAFKGPIPEGMTVDHIDGDYTNNTIENLQLLSHADNIRKSWDRRGRSKVRPIVKDWLERGYDRQFIADNLGISHAYISMIANQKR